MGSISVLSLTVMVLSAGSTVGFLVTPATRQCSSGVSRRSTAARFGSGAAATPTPRRTAAATMGLADAIPGPIKNIFSTKPAPSTTRRTRTEGAELYRTLGVTPDADYMEVMEATDRLKEKYAGDRKKVIKLDKAKDDIMALRLKQAVKGTIKTAEEAKDMDTYLDAKDEYLRKRDKELLVPEWAKGWFEPPDMDHLKQVAYRYAAFMAFTAGFPSATVGLQLVGGANCLGTIMNRGAPPLKRDDNGQIAEMRLPAQRTLIVSVLFTLGALNIGATVGQLVCKIFGESFILLESWQGMFVQLMYAVVCLFVTTWKDPADGPKIGRKPGLGGRRD